MHTVPVSESRFRITGKDSEEQEKKYTFLSEKEKKNKNCLVTTFAMIALFFFCWYSADLKLFIQRKLANNKMGFFQSVYVHMCAFLYMHTCKLCCRKCGFYAGTQTQGAEQSGMGRGFLAWTWSRQVTQGNMFPETWKVLCKNKYLLERHYFASKSNTSQSVLGIKCSPRLHRCILHVLTSILTSNNWSYLVYLAISMLGTFSSRANLPIEHGLM